MEINLTVVRRTVTALATACGVAALFLWAPLWIVFPVLLALSVLCQLEFYAMARRYEPLTVAGTLLGVAWMAGVWFYSGSTQLVIIFESVRAAGMAIPVVVLFGLAMLVLFSARRSNPIGSLAVTILGFLYVPFLMSFFLLYVDAGIAKAASCSSTGDDLVSVTRSGLYALGALLAVTKFSDMGGFALGLAFGKHKMCPSISPKKSWEGLGGSILAASLMAMLFCWMSKENEWGRHFEFWQIVSYPVAAAGGALIACVGTLGDLVESRFKRECGVKDSSSFMPAGMGGFLDMFDSILFVPALMYPVFSSAGYFV